jgi:hypothetical protein
MYTQDTTLCVQDMVPGHPNLFYCIFLLLYELLTILRINLHTYRSACVLSSRQYCIQCIFENLALKIGLSLHNFIG